MSSALCTLWHTQHVTHKYKWILRQATWAVWKVQVGGAGWNPQTEGVPSKMDFLFVSSCLGFLQRLEMLEAEMQKKSENSGHERAWRPHAVNLNAFQYICFWLRTLFDFWRLCTLRLDCLGRLRFCSPGLGKFSRQRLDEGENGETSWEHKTRKPSTCLFHVQCSSVSILGNQSEIIKNKPQDHEIVLSPSTSMSPLEPLLEDSRKRNKLRCAAVKKAGKKLMILVNRSGPVKDVFRNCSSWTSSDPELAAGSVDHPNSSQFPQSCSHEVNKCLKW